MFENEFYYLNNLRLRGFFSSPNFFGAFIVCCIPIFWFIEALALRIAAKGFRVGTLAITFLLEITFYWVLVRTYSRGALVTLVCIIGLSFVGKGISGISIATTTARVLCVIVFLFASSFIGRVSINYTSSDPSATNRLVVWKGAMQMSALRPISGWNDLTFQEVYGNWFQDINRGEEYRTPVNSYLDLLVKKGFIILYIILLLALSPFVIHFCRPKAARISDIHVNCVIIWTAYLLVNVFTTLHSVLEIRMIAICAFLVIWIVFLRNDKLLVKKIVVYSGTIALTVCLLLYASCLIVLKLSELEYKVSSDRGTLSISNKNRSAFGQFVFWPDTHVYGNYWGKSARLLLKEMSALRTIVVPLTNANPASYDSGDTLVVAGRQVSKLSLNHSNAQTIVVHPDGQVPLLTYNIKLIIIPQIDESGTSKIWYNFAKKNDIKSVTTKYSGQNITFYWKTCFPHFEIVK